MRSLTVVLKRPPRTAIWPAPVMLKRRVVQEVSELLSCANIMLIIGGVDRLNVYWSGVSPPSSPITVPSVGLWDSLGCYK